MSAFPVTVASESHANRGFVLGLAVHGDTVVAVGGQGSDLVLVSNDGVTWKQGRGKGKGLRGALVRDDGLWVVGERGYFARSEDLGKTWAPIKTKTGGCLFGVVEDAAGHLWIAGDDGYLAVSKDGKMPAKVEGVDESIGRISNSSLGVLVPADNPGHLYLANGTTVTKTGAKAGADLMSAVVTPSGTLITVGAKGVVLRSADKGESFAKIDVATTALLCAVECFEDGRVVIVGAGGMILVSTDDGLSFERVRHAATGGTLWCCRRYKDVLLAGGEDGVVVMLGEPRAVVAPAATSEAADAPAAPKKARPVREAPARPHWAAPAPSTAKQSWSAPAPLPVESKNGIWWTPQLRAMLHARRGGVAKIIRPLPTLDEAWATLRRVLWATDRAGMDKENRPSGIWYNVAFHGESTRRLGERILDPSPRVGSFEEDVALASLSFSRYGSFVSEFHEDLYESLADFLVVSVGLVEAVRRAMAGLEDELPYVGVGMFGRLRDLLAGAEDGAYVAARDVVVASIEQAIAKDPSRERHIADVRWAATFLFPLGPAAGDTERALHESALPNTVQFGDFGVHACGLAAGDLATLEHFLKKNGETRHEFFSPFDGRMYLASVLEIAGNEAGPVLARMKPSYPFEDDAHYNGLWSQLIAHIDHPAVLEALYKEHRTEGYVWGTAGLVTAARIDKERVLAFVRSKNDTELANLIEAEASRTVAPPKVLVPGTEIPAELTEPVPYEPPAARRAVPLTTRVDVPSEASWRDEEREKAESRNPDGDGVTWNDVSVAKLGPSDLETFVAHREKWSLPTSIQDLGLAPRSVHDRLMALGFSIAEYWTRWALPNVMVRNGLTHLPLLRAAMEDPTSTEAVLEAAQPFGDVALVPGIVKAFAGKKNKALARSWLLRHPRHGAAGALAIWSAGGEQAADATRVLRYLDGRGQRAMILELASAYDAAAVTNLLEADPLAAPKVKKPVLPAFASSSGLPGLVAVDGTKVDSKEVDELLVRLAFSNADEVHPGVIAAKARYTEPSRASFAWALFEAWLKEKADAKQGWCMQAVGFLGDDESARKLTALAKAWPGENASARAQAALDALLNIGTDAALININLLAEKSKFPAFKAAARERIDAIAYARGLTADELADRLVPTLGLEESGSRTLDLGSRSFEIVFGEDLLPCVKDADGMIHAELPKPNKTDDKALAKTAKDRFSALKKDARTSASLQIARMERAMRSARTISAEVFTGCFAKHPWMTHLAQRFVWGAFEGTTLKATFRVAEDGSLASVADETFELSPAMMVTLLHPLAFPEGELERWAQVFADYEILQPFPQLARPVFVIEESERAKNVLARFNDKTVRYAALRGLEARGWERWYDASVQMAQRLDARSFAVLDTEPGWHPSQTADDIEPQRIEGLRLSGGEGFGSLSPLLFSELVYDLETLTSS
ncbi:DUF4132 domain-containing protein [Labilithrix luteola]|nr:DUF4132 domain-containing protein [Labilithrix luteola]